MANYEPQNSRMVLVCEVGTTSTGQPKYSRLSISHVNVAATADAINAVADALALLISVPVAEIEKIDTNSVETL